MLSTMGRLGQRRGAKSHRSRGTSLSDNHTYQLWRVRVSPDFSASTQSTTSSCGLFLWVFLSAWLKALPSLTLSASRREARHIQAIPSASSVVCPLEDRFRLSCLGGDRGCTEHAAVSGHCVRRLGAAESAVVNTRSSTTHRSSRDRPSWCGARPGTSSRCTPSGTQSSRCRFRQ